MALKSLAKSKLDYHLKLRTEWLQLLISLKQRLAILFQRPIVRL